MIAELTNRAVLAVTGADSRPFLQGLLTADVLALTAGQPLYAGLLSPQGKALFTMILHDDGAGGVLVDVDGERAQALAKRLAMYRLRKAVTIAPAPLAVFAAWDDAAGQPAISAHAVDPRCAALGRRWLAPPGSMATAAAATAWDGHRLAVGIPEDAEIGSDDLLWLESCGDLLNGVSFTKGCYVGQENTARMHHRDKVRRRLLPVAIAGDPGDDRAIVDADGRSVGSWRGGSHGLGFAHLRVEAAMAPMACGGAVVTVRRLPWVEPICATADAG